jgi:Asp-tRNA(Asn)/Glu-tRNA(Gln) amidotransferase A subunit family amidase
MTADGRTVRAIQPILIDRIESPDGVHFRADVMEFTALASLTGVPALTIRGATARHGLPIGFR